MSVKVFDKQGAKVRLDAISAEPPKGMTREKAEKRFATLGQELFDLQDAMFGSKASSVLVVLQGRDSAGKDGAIKHVVGCLNPRGVIVTSFGVPTPEERGHDFLWRVHRHAPRLGEFSIFNRSHYEDVLVVRVHGLAPKSVWSWLPSDISSTHWRRYWPFRRSSIRTTCSGPSQWPTCPSAVQSASVVHGMPGPRNTSSPAGTLARNTKSSGWIVPPGPTTTVSGVRPAVP